MNAIICFLYCSSKNAILLHFYMLLVQTQFHPWHSPDALPRRWQSNRHVDSAAQRANSEGVNRSLEHSHP